jgi:REP element-mobilizing transposase RayT
VKCIRDCIQQAHTADFRIIHFSVMPDKLHLIVEADSRRALSRGMQGLKIRIARQVNPILKRKGTMFLERYRALIVKSPLDAKQALESVLKAFRFEYPRRRHPKGWIDPFSSAPFFGGWAGKTVTDRDKLGENVTTAATRPILRGLWKRFGLLQPDTPDEGTVFSPPGRTR